jgi:hypothetical protein
MEESLAHANVVIIGHKGRLRNTKLASIDDEIIFVAPVYFKSELPYSRLLRLPFELFLNGRFLKQGERGCSLAHIEARHQAKQLKYDWTLILEDDVDLPKNWLASVSLAARGIDGLSNYLILLNSNFYLSQNRKFGPLPFKPSYANAYLIHRSVILDRRYKRLEKYEIADWPISFSRIKFYSVDGLAVDTLAQSQIGRRRTSRTYLVLDALVRLLFSPLLALILRVNLFEFLKWNVIGPLYKDIYLRIRWQLRSSKI